MNRWYDRLAEPWRFMLMLVIMLVVLIGGSTLHVGTVTVLIGLIAVLLVVRVLPRIWA
jgi:hypothetical protein